MSATAFETLDETPAPSVTAPSQSNKPATSTPRASEIAPEPTEVAHAFATSFAPMLKAIRHIVAPANATAGSSRAGSWYRCAYGAHAPAPSSSAVASDSHARTPAAHSTTARVGRGVGAVVAVGAGVVVGAVVTVGAGVGDGVVVGAVVGAGVIVGSGVGAGASVAAATKRTRKSRMLLNAIASSQQNL